METRQIVSNESGEILRMLNGAFDEYAEHDVDLYPQPLRPEIDALNERLYPNLNNGVYEAGFSQNQAAYETACGNVFAVLDELEERLASTRYLVGDTPTEADWRLFPTLVRFDTVYYLHFNCNLRRDRRLPESLGLRARPLPATGHLRDGRHGPDQASLLHDARHDQPEPHRPRRARDRLLQAARSRLITPRVCRGHPGSRVGDGMTRKR